MLGYGAGFCDLCQKESWFISLRKFNVQPSNDNLGYLNGALGVCGGCHWRWSHSLEKLTESKKMTGTNFEMTNREKKFISALLKLRTVFKEEIEDFYILPTESVPYDDYKSRVNIVVGLKSMSCFQYCSAANKETLNLMDFWNRGDHDKFWSNRMTKLILTIMTVHYKYQVVNIWVRGYNKTYSVEVFASNQLSQVHPDFLIMLNDKILAVEGTKEPKNVKEKDNTLVNKA